jgi:hypothetical protein
VTPVLLGILGQGAAGAGGTTAFESIATTTVGSGGASSVEFDLSSVTGYTHLQLRMIVRDDKSATSNNVGGYFNTDSNASNYYWHFMDGDGGSAYAGSSTGTSTLALNFALAFSASAGASRFGASVVDILDYKNTNKNKVIRALMGLDNNGNGQLRFASGLWNNTSAITKITLNPQGSYNFVQYSSFALYGIK